MDIPVVFSDYYRGDFDPSDFSAARVYDLWKDGASMGEFRQNFTAKAVAPHSCRAVRLDVVADSNSWAPAALKTDDQSRERGATGGQTLLVKHAGGWDSSRSASPTVTLSTVKDHVKTESDDMGVWAWDDWPSCKC